MLIIVFQKTRHRLMQDTQLETNFFMRHRPSESHNFALLEVRQLHLSWHCRLVLMAGLGRGGDLGEELCQLALHPVFFMVADLPASHTLPTRCNAKMNVHFWFYTG